MGGRAAPPRAAAGGGEGDGSGSARRCRSGAGRGRLERAGAARVRGGGAYSLAQPNPLVEKIKSSKEIQVCFDGKNSVLKLLLAKLPGTKRDGGGRAAGRGWGERAGAAVPLQDGEGGLAQPTPSVCAGRIALICNEEPATKPCSFLLQQPLKQAAFQGEAGSGVETDHYYSFLRHYYSFLHHYYPFCIHYYPFSSYYDRLLRYYYIIRSHYYVFITSLLRHYHLVRHYYVNITVIIGPLLQ